jgi:hypothetical protein
MERGWLPNNLSNDRCFRQMNSRTLKAFKIQKSFIVWPDDKALRLPDKEVFEMIIEIFIFQSTNLLLNLHWFRQYHIKLKNFIMTIRILHCGDQPLLQTSIISWWLLKLMLTCRRAANQFYILVAKGQWRNIYKHVSTSFKQREQEDELNCNLKEIERWFKCKNNFSFCFVLIKGK